MPAIWADGDQPWCISLRFPYNIIAGRELVNCLFCLPVFERMVYHPFRGTFSARFFLYSFLGSVILQSQRIFVASSSVSLYSCNRSCKKPKVLPITIGSASFMSKNISANASKLLETSKILSIASQLLVGLFVNHFFALSF